MKDDERQPAKPTWNVPPGYYDDCEYVEENEYEFGYSVYLAELAEIRRLKFQKLMQEKLREGEEE